MVYNLWVSYEKNVGGFHMVVDFEVGLFSKNFVGD